MNAIARFLLRSLLAPALGAWALSAQAQSTYSADSSASSAAAYPWIYISSSGTLLIMPITRFLGLASV